MAFSFTLTTIWLIAAARFTFDLVVEELPRGGACSALYLTVKVTAMLQYLSSDILLVRTNQIDSCSLRFLTHRAGISHVHAVE
jgi:hypothetical protein